MHISIDAECTKLDIKTKLVIAFIIGYFVVGYFSFDTTVLKNVEMEPFSEPIQTEIVDGKTFEHKVPHGKAYITPVSEYKIYGRVMQEHYRPSKMYSAAVYPFDVSIGYGLFQHKEVYKAIKVRMVETVSYWNYSAKAWDKHLSKYVKNNGDIEHYFTNNHLCPANKNVRRGISKLKKKDIVYLEGFLIKYTYMKNDGSIQKGYSSTSRDDSFRGNNGSGNCEQIFVTRVVSRHGDFS